MPVDLTSLEILKVYYTPSGWAFVPVWYGVDPAKDAAWMADARKHYPRETDWDREMEIDFGQHKGAKVYPGYTRAKHWHEEIAYEPRLPLVLAADFNASPMAWLVGQVVGGWVQILEDLVRDPGTIEGGVAEFRDTYPQHAAGVVVYGDASVKSFYDTMRLAFRGYKSPVTFRIPERNPPVKDRCNAVQLKLNAADGYPGIRIQGPKCPQLIQDFEEVVWRPNGKDILKTTDPNDPYTKRTHISDALGYWIVHDWSVPSEVSRRNAQAKPRQPLDFSKALGGLHYKK